MHNKHRVLFITFLALALVLGACSQTASESAGSENAPDVHWGYEGESGPENWGNLNPEYALCGRGVEQSPIDITAAAVQDLADIVTGYETTAVNILNNGHTIQVNVDEGSRIELDGTPYNLLQFHFHAPSEHAVDGTLADAEMHLVHSDEAGNLAVVGVMIQEGAENPNFSPVWDNLPQEESDVTTIEDASVHIVDLLPDSLLYSTYSGSLTTPPCSENVKWLVLTTPIELSPAQIDAFSSIIGDNNRPLQPLGEREILQDSTSAN